MRPSLSLSCMSPSSRLPRHQLLISATVREVRSNPDIACGPSVTLASGEVLHADLIVAAVTMVHTLTSESITFDHVTPFVF